MNQPADTNDLPVRVRRAAWLARAAFLLVFAINVQCAASFVLWPDVYAPSFEVAGVPGAAAVQGLGIAFLMWNATYPAVIASPLRFRAVAVIVLVQQAIDEGIPAQTILTEGLLKGMDVVGEKFKNNEIFVPEVLVAARAMNMGVALLKPLLAAQGVKASGKVCIGTVQGDLHDIGKNLVKMMMEGKGLEVVDLGTDVSPENFVRTAKEQNCQVICCSALLTTTMDVMGEVVKEAEREGIRDKVKIMVGGAPVTDAFAKSIGADAYTPDAASAADVAAQFCA